MELKIKPKKRNKKSSRKGFDPNIDSRRKVNWRYFAIELNKETWEVKDNQFPDLRNNEIIDTLELHHVSIRPIESSTDIIVFQHWADELVGSVYVSPYEILAEFYAIWINTHALSLGANVGRIYHNAYLGDNRIHANSIGHIFEPSEYTLSPELMVALDKYLTVEHIVNGQDITLRNRLGNQGNQGNQVEGRKKERRKKGNTLRV